MSDTNPELQAMSLPELLAQTVDCRNGHHSWTERGHGPCSACGEPSPPPVMPQLECGCLQGACHGGHTIDVGLDQARPDEARLRTFVQHGRYAEPEEVTAMAAELLALRAYAADHEDRCNTLCPRCGIEVDHEIGNLTRAEYQAALDAMPASIDHDQAGAAELEAERDDAPVEVEPEGYGDCTPAPMPPDIAAAKARIAELEAERPRFSQRQFIQAHRDRDEAQSRAAELAERFAELEAERDQHAETARQATNHAINSAATIATIRHALAGHPRCEEHPEGDVIKCGWKRAVASVQAAVDASPARREPVAYTVIHSISAVEVAFTGRYFHDRARAERRAADDGPSYRVVALVELREVGEP